MRSTVDLPPAVHRKVRELAAQRGQSISAVIAELTTYGLGRLDQSVVIGTDSVSGFPVVSVGRPISVGDVVELLDEE